MLFGVKRTLADATLEPSLTHSRNSQELMRPPDAMTSIISRGTGRQSGREGHSRRDQNRPEKQSEDGIKKAVMSHETAADAPVFGVGFGRRLLFLLELLRLN
jgi:hypothetical protein